MKKSSMLVHDSSQMHSDLMFCCCFMMHFECLPLVFRLCASIFEGNHGVSSCERAATIPISALITGCPHNELRSVCHTNGLVFGVKRFWFCLGASCNEYTKQTDLECFKPNVFPKNVLRESITPSKTLKTFETDPGAVSIVCSMVSHN